jgi:transposase-like protein
MPSLGRNGYKWSNRPLDPVYPVIFIDAIVVKVRDGQVRNKPIYVVVGVTVRGERDILGLWVGAAVRAPSSGCRC